MDLWNAIASRHSYRGTFTNEPVPQSALMKIAEAGVRAPSGCNRQTTHICLVSDPKTRKAIASILPKATVQTAQAIIVVVSDNRPAYENTSFAKEDYAAAVENMLLAITALGYASVWLDGVLRYDGIAEKIADLIGLTDREHMTVSVILPIGKPETQEKQQTRLPLAERIYTNRMG